MARARSERNAFDEVLSEDLRRLAARRRLRDAAPQLLAACENAATLLDALQPGSKVATECRAAIAKAKGNHHV